MEVNLDLNPVHTQNKLNCYITLYSLTALLLSIHGLLSFIGEQPARRASVSQKLIKNPHFLTCLVSN